LTPFGSPVVPEVYEKAEQVSGFGSRRVPVPALASSTPFS